MTLVKSILGSSYCLVRILLQSAIPDPSARQESQRSSRQEAAQRTTLLGRHLFKPSLQMSVPLYHAELLSNIRSITVSINLPSPSDLSTKLTRLTPSQLQLHHDGKTTTFNLPANIALSATALLENSRIIVGETKLSYRLPVSPESCPTSPITSAGSENYVPWSAVSLSSSAKDISIRCKFCSSELVPGEKINTWKDLPSSNWADMMDIWHCHKPETGSKQPDAGDRYAGLNQGYVAVKGTALVELTYFLVAKENCGSAVEIIEVIQFGSPFPQEYSPFVFSPMQRAKRRPAATERFQWLSVPIQLPEINYPDWYLDFVFLGILSLLGVWQDP